jgi:uncharacterized protein YdhG (YjbR/CyaY superfamily)
MSTNKFSTIDEYHSAFPKDIQEKMETIRKAIKQVIPQAKEVISYNMPAFKLNGIIVYYAAYKKHISLYPAPSGKEWEKDFEPYHTSGKGTIQFPFNQPIPVDLIKKIVKFRVGEVSRKHESKK